MAEEILDGTGGGYQAAVDSDNRLRTLAITRPENLELNLDNKTWSLYLSTLPAAADDYFFYLKNTGSNTIRITDIRVKSTVATTLYYDHVEGTPTYTAAVDITPTSRNLSSNASPLATIKYDTDITGLTNNGVLFYERLDTADKMFHLRTSSNIIITPGTAFAMRRETATGAIEAVISIVEQVA